MQRIIRQFIVPVLIAALITVPLAGTVAAADAYEMEDLASERMAADLLLCRPMGIIATMVGGLLFVVSLPFSVFTEPTAQENIAQVGVNADKFIGEPLTYTFNRRLGDF